MFPIGHQLAAKQKVNFEPCLNSEVLIFQVFWFESEAICCSLSKKGKEKFALVSLP